MARLNCEDFWLPRRLTRWRSKAHSSKILLDGGAAQKSQCLKGKARKKAKEAASKSTPPTESATLPSLPRYTIKVKDFVTMAEYLSTKAGLKVPSTLWARVNRAIQLRKMHNDYHTFQDVHDSEVKSTERHFYFLGILEKVRVVLKPRLSADLLQAHEEVPPLETTSQDTNGRFGNMFATLTVEEPSEEFLKASNVKSNTNKVEVADAIY
jgi:hypothetical protein